LWSTSRRCRNTGLAWYDKKRDPVVSTNHKDKICALAGVKNVRKSTVVRDHNIHREGADPEDQMA